MKLYTVGYGRWPTRQRFDRLVKALLKPGVNLLVDVRHSPCPSSSSPTSNYGPRAWHLQASGERIDALLVAHGIEYRWMVELGNPQKTDPEMAVLREHLVSADERWPVNRGLRLLNELVRAEGRRCCLMCACPDYEVCHRKAIADTLNERFFASVLAIHDLSRGRG